MSRIRKFGSATDTEFVCYFLLQCILLVCQQVGYQSYFMQVITSRTGGIRYEEKQEIVVENLFPLGVFVSLCRA